MFTDEQRAIFSKMLDLNYDAKYETDPIKKMELIRLLDEQQDLMIKSMGLDEWNAFLSRGRQMFAPQN